MDIKEVYVARERYADMRREAERRHRIVRMTVEARVDTTRAARRPGFWRWMHKATR